MEDGEVGYFVSCAQGGILVSCQVQYLVKICQEYHN
jgi:hypothetical protein